MNIYNPFSLLGKKILITGASSGIGRQCAIDCSRIGAKVVIIGRDINRLKETYNSLSGDGHLFICEDLINFKLIGEQIKNTVECYGKYDGFIHAAGVEKTQLLKNLKPQDYLDTYSTNFITGVNVLKELTRKSNYNPGFKTVFISSITALIARVGTLAYTASKGAMVAAVRELAIELAPKCININCISPGTIRTPMMEKVLQSMDEEDKQKRLGGFALGLGECSDISNACIFLLSDAARWITGQNLVIDGGYTAK